jgi:hypothetical protein
LQKPLPMFLHFVHMGIAHIGSLASEWIGPHGFRFPDGIDHILFIVALVLSGGGFKEMLKTVTGFTAGHSISLALSFFHLVNLPSRWVESAIALSIAYIAAEDLLRRDVRHRWRIAAVFGLVHGLGFADALRGLHLRPTDALVALAGFNVGVELGQAVILATLTPLVLAMRRDPLLKVYGPGSCSAAVLLIGGYWFFLRAFA